VKGRRLSLGSDAVVDALSVDFEGGLPKEVFTCGGVVDVGQASFPERWIIPGWSWSPD
jgi:hypothetical protein